MTQIVSLVGDGIDRANHSSIMYNLSRKKAHGPSIVSSPSFRHNPGPTTVMDPLWQDKKRLCSKVMSYSRVTLQTITLAHEKPVIGYALRAPDLLFGTVSPADRHYVGNADAKADQPLSVPGEEIHTIRALHSQLMTDRQAISIHR